MADGDAVDGGEGGTGAAPPEYSNSVGMPLNEGLTVVHNMLRSANIRDKITVIASGKVSSGFSIVRALALGADVCNAARSMMLALGCIQAFKCNTNTCPTGIATQDKRLMAGTWLCLLPTACLYCNVTDVMLRPRCGHESRQSPSLPNEDRKLSIGDHRQHWPQPPQQGRPCSPLQENLAARCLLLRRSLPRGADGMFL